LVKNRFLLTCREACINSDDAEMSSIYLRIYKVDPLVDTLVKKSAKKAFDKAEIEFGNHNYKGAMEYYSDALEIQPDYYKARLYLGDALYSTKNYMGAIKNYRLAHLFHPDLAEPVKYLVDAYFHEKLYDSAFYYAKIGMMIYPDYSMVQKFESASARVGDRIKLHWLNRDVLPNTNEKGLISTPTDFEKKYIEAEGKDWKNYQAAQIEILQYCNEKGIIKTDNPITKQKYAEVYAWDKMLEKTTDTKFDFAKKMKEKGYLDCYVLMSCFHYDFYRQYKSFVKKNEDKLMKYFEILKSN
jgi:tetratricopeptide (TPR) repeat protein